MRLALRRNLFVLCFPYRNCPLIGLFVSLCPQKSSMSLAKLQVFASHPARKILLQLAKESQYQSIRCARFINLIDRSCQVDILFW